MSHFAEDSPICDAVIVESEEEEVEAKKFLRRPQTQLPRGGPPALPPPALAYPALPCPALPCSYMIVTGGGDSDPMLPGAAWSCLALGCSGAEMLILAFSGCWGAGADEHQDEAGDLTPSSWSSRSTWGASRADRAPGGQGDPPPAGSRGCEYEPWGTL